MGKRHRNSHPAVFAKELSANPKLGQASATYVAQQSCPRSSLFLGAGCCAENGFLGGFITKRLNRAVSPDIDPGEIAAQEAAAIDELTGERDLRLHVVGDSITVQGTRRIADAAQRYTERGGGKVWSYTHAWGTVPRSAWGPVSILASCETERDVIAAHDRGYATSIVVERHETHRRSRLGSIDVLPCPEQTRGVPCVKCRLCMDDRRLHDARTTIALSIHGSRVSKGRALRALALLR